MSTPVTVLDRRLIDELRALHPDDTELIGQIVTMFEQDGATRIAEIEAAAGTGDLQAVREAAHSLKGASRTIGALELGDLCERVEKQAVEPTESDMGALTDAFGRACARLRELTAS